MLETIIVVLLILWLLGVLGPIAIGSGVHVLLVVVLVLIVIRLLRGGKL